MNRKCWNLLHADKDKAAEISEKFNIDPFAALIMTARGITDDSEIHTFIDDTDEFDDPFLLPDMQKAVDKINEAVAGFKRICIFGDYDADGVTATALIYSYLESQGADVIYYIPDRFSEGYGLSETAVKKMADSGTKLILTVDNGISAVSESELIYSLGMEMIITDHHLPSDVLPRAEAIVDPHRTDCSCPFNEYSGVGVAFKLACALENDIDLILEQYSDITAIGTVADIVPLKGENRKIVKHGIRMLNRTERIGIKELSALAGIKDGKITAVSIAFALGPRINAAGRMNTAEDALKLLLCEDPDEAKELATLINDENIKRHEVEETIINQAEKYLEKNPDAAMRRVLVIAGENFHEGVLGIAASKLSSEYSKPCIVISYDENGARGSARSISGFSIYEALKYCKDILKGFGGHDKAAGCSLETGKISEFADKINEYAQQSEFAFPELVIDCKLNPAAVSVDFLDSIDTLAPFGAMNPVPVFEIAKMVIESINPMGNKSQHIKLNLHKFGNESVKVSAVKFNTTAADLIYTTGDTVDIAVELSRNEYMGRVNVSLFLKEIRPSGANDNDYRLSQDISQKLSSGVAISSTEADKAYCTRENCTLMYRFLKQNKTIACNPEYIAYKINDESVDAVKSAVMIIAFLQLGLIEKNGNRLSVCEIENKVNLESADVFKEINDALSRNGKGGV